MILGLVLALIVGILAAGCGGGAASENKRLTLGYIEWDENVALSNLTKVLLEQELGYEEVELQLADVGPVFQGVASGDLDGFQDVWMPLHENYIEDLSENIEHLDPWYEGQTELGLAAPTYLNIDSIDQLNSSNVETILGIEPGTVIMKTVQEEVMPAYDLNAELISSSTPAMLASVDRSIAAEEPFAFIAWSPHWMNARYDFVYLEDPKGAFGDATDPAELSTVVRDGLSEDDPVAYEFLKSVRLTGEHVNELELEINEANDPITGVEAWLEDNREAVQPWIDNAKEAREG